MLVDGDAEFTQKPLAESVKRAMQAQNPRERQSRGNAQRQRPQVDTTVTEATDRFYKLVEDVYLLKLQNGNYDR